MTQLIGAFFLGLVFWMLIIAAMVVGCYIGMEKSEEDKK